MHQNLSSTYWLNQPYSPDSDKSWQTLAASQAYGTFFTISGKFRFKENTKIPEYCELYLQNYQGNVTIGIHSIKKEIEVVKDPLFNRPAYVLVVYLKALHTKIKEQQSVIIKSDITDMNEFKKDFNLKIEFVYKEAKDFVTPSKNHISDGNRIITGFERFTFIDEHRVVREGDDFVIPEYNERIDINIQEFYAEYCQKNLAIPISNFIIKSKKREKSIDLKNLDLNIISVLKTNDKLENRNLKSTLIKTIKELAVTDLTEPFKSNLIQSLENINESSSEQKFQSEALRLSESLINAEMMTLKYTVTGGGYLKEGDIYDHIMVVDANNDSNILLNEKVIKPYPCAHNYVRLVN
ncbi:hypothetical protein SAMN04489761_4015 [Tenacibaculum sp. MAR_2009_124]|uniref:hypothetical protein n=1 Tax=Tenacibaculum sp. MAR_2009_124 TaxID=1250059 RepID=UPI0008942D0A|nr:hypothetical protein [Tenacibaculum sp. MAR_2009_124]SEC93556.1 hypothetical protein SAMN04489761_4015 [Tenacibaculum sp. MAR_2009_124]